MKRFFILLSALALSVGAFAQLQQGVYDERVFVEYEENASFPGGDKACIAWLKEHIKYPKDCLKNKIEGRVKVSFIVEKDGSIDSIKVRESPHPWKPARYMNKCKRSLWILPVTFNLPQSTEKKE